MATVIYFAILLCASLVFAWAHNMRRLLAVSAFLSVVVAIDYLWPSSARFCSVRYENCLRSGLETATGPFGQFFGWLMRTSGLG